MNMLRLLNHFKAGSAYLLIVWISFVVPASASAEFSQEVLEIQQGLERLGYNSRPFDGLWGAVTQAALDEFCEDQSLNCDDLYNNSGTSFSKEAAILPHEI